MDAAMPALTRLREIANAAPQAEASVSERLLFWTPLGARSLACEIRRAGPAEQPMLLQVTADVPAAHPAGDLATGPPPPRARTPRRSS